MMMAVISDGDGDDGNYDGNGGDVRRDGRDVPMPPSTSHSIDFNKNMNGPGRCKKESCCKIAATITFVGVPPGMGSFRSYKGGRL